jgi:hypothetical protein
MIEYRKKLGNYPDKNNVLLLLKIKIIRSSGKDFPIVGRDYISEIIMERINCARDQKREKQDLKILYLSSAPGTGKTKILNDIQKIINKSNMDKDYLKNAVYINITYNNGCSLITDEYSLLAKDSLISRLIFSYYFKNYNISFYKFFTDFKKYLKSIKIEEIFEYLVDLDKDDYKTSENKSKIFILGIDEYNMILNNTSLENPREYLKEICSLLMSLMYDYKLVCLFSGTIEESFKNIFLGSFPACIKLNTPLISYEDISLLTSLLSEKTEYKNLKLIFKKIDFLRILKILGGHMRSYEKLIDIITSYKNIEENFNFQDILQKLKNNLKLIIPNSLIDDNIQLLIIKYSLSRIPIKKNT